MERMYNILYVDDEISNLNIFKNTFRRYYNVFKADSAKAGLEILDRESIDLILTDQRMPEMSGLDFLNNVILKYPEPSRILITAYTDFDVLKEAINKVKIFQYIQKPWDESEVKKIIDNALEIHFLKQKNQRLTEELRTKNKELEKLNNELLNLDKIKFQFLNIISHEIRTPLNGLVGATTLFKDELKDNELIKYEMLIHILESSVQRLSHFLLLAERITAFKTSRYKLNPEIIDINKLINEVVEGSKHKLEAKKINLILDLCNEKNTCLAEKQLIDICLSEILDNAIKHSEFEGKVIIKTCSKDENITIEIIDEGPGFPKHVLNNIFKAFITDEDITKQGMGLDLALINHIVGAHNGKINISNNKHTGATVKLIFISLDLFSENSNK